MEEKTHETRNLGMKRMNDEEGRKKSVDYLRYGTLIKKEMEKGKIWSSSFKGDGKVRKGKTKEKYV